jgi:hypothetical protein
LVLSTQQITRWAPYILLGLIVLAWLALRLPPGVIEYRYMDERIAEGVVRGVMGGDLDTNWARHRVTNNFRYDQYNFSSYNLTLAAIGRVWTLFGGAFDLSAMRLWSALFAAASIAVTFAIGRHIGGAALGLIGALLTASSVQLYVDSLYARPDSFFMLLTLIATWLSLLATGRHWRTLAFAYAVLGFAIACKITAALLLPAPALIFLLRTPQRDLGALARIGAVCTAALFIGAFIGMPYAFAHPGAFIAGALRLVEQYAAPTGYHDGTLLGGLWYVVRYLGPTLGWLTFALAIAGAVIAATPKARAQFGWTPFILFATALVTIFYTGSRPTFFERNFSHVLPVIFIAAGFTIQHIAARLPSGWPRAAAPAALALACFAQPFALTSALRFNVLSGERAQQLEIWRTELRHANPGTTYIQARAIRQYAFWQRFLTRVATTSPPYLVEIQNLGDPQGAATIRHFECAYEARKLAASPSPFAGVPASWLVQGFDSTVIMYRVERAQQREGCRDANSAAPSP